MKTHISNGELLRVFLLAIFAVIQSSCGTSLTISPTATLANSTATMMVADTPTASPTLAQSVTPAAQIEGTWSEGPSMLSPRSAHAVVSSDSVIYALAGTNDRGNPVLDVESFDGEQWKVETTPPQGTAYGALLHQELT